MNPASYTTAQKIFVNELAKKIFAKNDFLKLSKDWSKYVQGNQVIWQQSGNIPQAVINNATQAITAGRRNDTPRQFSVDEYQTQATRLDWSEELLVNYDKRADILEQHLMQIAEDIAMRILANWCLGAKTVRTTGASRATSLAGATLTRKGVIYKDIVKARKLLVDDEISLDAGKLNMLVPSALEQDIMNLTEFQSRDYSSQNADSSVISGKIGTIAGFNVFVRSSALVTSAAGVAQLRKVDDTFVPRTVAATDNQGIVMWHSDYVVRAAPKNQKVSIIDQHGGTEFSVTALAGGASVYNDNKGVVMLIEEA